MAAKETSPKKPGKTASKGILRRLARDESGNAILIVAAATVPLLGAIGGGIDMTRGYMAQARLA
ncbi:MAG: pilus assembly protein TadG-related protein, partial [Pseudomonadota bacterium]